MSIQQDYYPILMLVYQRTFSATFSTCYFLHSAYVTYCTASSPPVAQSGQVSHLWIYILMVIKFIFVHSSPITGAAKNSLGKLW